MLRVKFGDVSGYVKDCAIMAMEEISEKTNVQFFNSIEDPEYLEPYHIKFPNIQIRYGEKSQIGSSDIGMKYNEDQYIYVPKEFKNSNDETEMVAFFLHSFCNAAAMYNEQQRKDRDNYISIHWENLQNSHHWRYNKAEKNFHMIGDFDFKSITLSWANDYSINGRKTLSKKNSGSLTKNTTLSELDRAYLNYFYLPFVPRKDTYGELEEVVFDRNNRQLTEEERINLQAQLNNGNPIPPEGGRLELVPW